MLLWGVMEPHEPVRASPMTTLKPHRRQHSVVATRRWDLPSMPVTLLLIAVMLGSAGAAMESTSPLTTTVAGASQRPHLRGVILLRANLREGPSMHSEVVAVAKEGDQVDVLEVSGPWVRIKTEAGGEAWVYKSLLRLEQVPPEPAPRAPPAESSSSPASPGDPIDAPALIPYPLPASEAPALPGELPFLAQPLDVAESRAPTSIAAVLAWGELIGAHIQAVSGYLLAGLAGVLIISIALQLRAARQLRRTMHEMSHILEVVEAIQAEIPTAPALGATPTAALPGPPGASSLAAGSLLPLTSVERAVLETIAEHGEVQERELSRILAGKGCPRVLIKAVIGDLIRKTAADGVPWVEARYVQGHFIYRLRGQGRPASRHGRWQG